MMYRFTLSHDILGELEISEPGGWDESYLQLERDKEFHSLIETFDGEFIFYGTDGVNNGGIEFIKQAIQTYGFDAEVIITIEESSDGVTYSDFYRGELDLEAKREMPDNQMMVPITRESFWTKFFNRLDTPVNIQSTTNLDDDLASVFDSTTIDLISQKIRYSGEYRWDESVTYDGNEAFYQLDWDKTVTDDLKKFQLPRTFVESSVANTGIGMVAQFEAPWDGTYTFEAKNISAVLAISDWSASPGNGFFVIGRSGNSETVNTQRFTETTLGPYGSDTLLEATYNGSFTLKKGEQIVIYYHNSSNVDRTFFGETRWAYKTDCVAATTGNITLSGTQTIDGVAVIVGDRVLVKDQGDPTENGIYVVSAGAWSYAADMNQIAEFELAAVYVTGGTTNIDTAWKQTAEVTSVFGSAKTFEYLTPTDERTNPYPAAADPVESYVIVTADTTYQDTEAEGFYTHDVAGMICDRYIGEGNCFYSDFLGSPYTEYRQYSEEGCGSGYVNVKGLQLRQYTLSEKPFFLSFKQWWNGLNPILNLGLGYELLDDSPERTVIRVEQKEHFYSDEISVNFSNVRDITSVYDPERIFKSVKVGYKKGLIEDVSGIDDPQNQTRATPFKKSGKPLELESEFIAAGLAVEATRRQVFETKDYKFDNDTFIIDTYRSGDTAVPFMDEEFDSVSGINNSSYRYNLILSPLHNFFRWMNYINGCMQKHLTSSYKFVSGEGNFDMTTDYSCSVGQECKSIICSSFSEDSDIAMTPFGTGVGFLHLPDLFEIKIPMTKEEYQAINENREKAIGISQTTTGHVAFSIKSLKYNHRTGDATISAWPKEEFTIQIIDSNNETQCE